MQQEGYQSVIKQEELYLTGIGTTPSFAIGQRALLVQTERGNLLWDCITFLDEAAIQAVQQLGGIAAIAISHPHYYSSMVDGGAIARGLLAGDSDEGTKVINHTGALATRAPRQMSPAECWDLDNTARTGRNFVLSLLATPC